MVLFALSPAPLDGFAWTQREIHAVRGVRGVVSAAAAVQRRKVLVGVGALGEVVVAGHRLFARHGAVVAVEKGDGLVAVWEKP